MKLSGAEKTILSALARDGEFTGVKMSGKKVTGLREWNACQKLVRRGLAQQVEVWSDYSSGLRFEMLKIRGVK